MEREDQYTDRVAEIIKDTEAMIMLMESKARKACQNIKGLDQRSANRQIESMSSEIRSQVREMLAREFRNSFFPRDRSE